MPALALDDGTVIADAVAICQYIEELHPDPPLIGATPQERAVVTALNRQIERDGFFAAMDAFRNTAGPKGRALPGPHDYEQIPDWPSAGARASCTSTPHGRAAGRERIRRRAPADSDRRYHPRIGLTVEFAKWAKLAGAGQAAPHPRRWFEQVCARPSAKA